MKLVIFVVLSLAALTWADSSYSDYQNNYQNYYEPSTSPDYYPSNGVAAGSNRRQSLFDKVSNILLPNRRQGLGGGLGGAGAGLGLGLGGGLGGLVGLIVPAVIIIVVIIGVVAIAGFAATSLTSSGRGLDSDEWEVDHSVWMNQLQKDFEDSWSTE